MERMRRRRVFLRGGWKERDEVGEEGKRGKWKERGGERFWGFAEIKGSIAM